MNSETPRAEELILEVYRQRDEFRKADKLPRGVVLSSHHYQIIRMYHARLGVMKNESFEYLDKDGLFGLEFFIDNSLGFPKVI